MATKKRTSGRSSSGRKTQAELHALVKDIVAEKRKQGLLSGDHSRKIRPYSPKVRFDYGDRIEHPQFGSGVVSSLINTQKIEVAFPDCTRVLIHAKAA
ncbi:MAG: hypothetical protein R3B54_18760 [Bdellovibrionota bacterium]